MEGPDLQSRLNEIGALQGRMPIDGTRIQDDGVVPLPEEFKPRPPVDLSQVPDGPSYDLDDEEENLASPLIPKQAVIELPPEPLGPVPDLSLFGNDNAATIAAYMGAQVELTPQEAVGIRRIVKGAIVRQLREQINSLIPKRRRRSKTTKALDKIASGMAGFPIQTSIPPEGGPALLVQSKRKGRPRGSKNKPKDRQPGSEAQ